MSDDFVPQTLTIPEVDGFAEDARKQCEKAILITRINFVQQLGAQQALDAEINRIKAAMAPAVPPVAKG